MSYPLRHPIGRIALATTALLAGLTGTAQAASREAEADRALSGAESAIAAAREHRALWTTAAEALRRARSARAQGDLDAATHWSREACQLARLGLEQAGAPEPPPADCPAGP